MKRASILGLCLCLAAAMPAGAQTHVAPLVCGGPTTIVTGGTAITPVTGSRNGGYILNPYLAADQGIVTAEPIYVDPVATAGVAGNGTTAAIQPGQQYNLIPGASGGVSVNAATTGHKIVCVRF